MKPTEALLAHHSEVIWIITAHLVAERKARID